MSSVKVSSYKLNDDYSNILGFDAGGKASSLQWSSPTLPAHTGMIVLFNIFATELTKARTMNISLQSRGKTDQTTTLLIPRNAGSNINEKPGN